MSGSASRAPKLVEDLGKTRPERFIFVHEINVGARKGLRGEPFDPGAQIAFIVVCPPQAQVAALRRRDECGIALFVVRNGKNCAAAAKRFVHVVVPPRIVAKIESDALAFRQQGKEVAQPWNILF